MTSLRNVVGFLSLVALLAFPACRDRTGDTDAGTATAGGAPAEDLKLARQSVERTQTSLREVTDVLVQQAALQNSVQNDPAITEAIRQYEALQPAERIRFVVTNDRFRDIFSAWGDPTENVPATPELRAAQSKFPFLPASAARPAEAQNFDLALRKSDVFARQVRLTNALFNDADPKVLSVVDAWQKLTPDQKRTFVATPENTAYYWNYLYLTYRLQLLRYYWIYTRECYWGYRIPREIQVFDPKQFDLKLQGVQQ